jgi:acetylornithine deacetylase
MPVTTEQVVDLLSAMVRIESVTPWLIPTGSGERDVAEFIAGWLADTPAEVEIVEVEPGRPNLLARLRGTGGGQTLCLNAHTDTVGYAAWPDQALAPRIEGDLMYGLGAADDKAGCAAALLVLRALAESGTAFSGDLLVACVADEEGISIGSEHLAASGGIDAAIVIEPQPHTDELVVEHQGFGWIDVICHGAAAHGSAPDAGIDAIVHLAEVITRMHKHDKEVFTAKPSLMNGRTVFHTGTISGGTDYATYPSQAKLGIEIGTQPGEHLADRVKEIEAIFADIARIERGFSGEIVVQLDRDPFVATGHEDLQAIVVPAMTSVLGKPPKITGVNAWTDAALMQAAGIPTLLMGSTGGNFHTANEWVSIKELVKLCAILERVATQYLA